MPLRSYIYKITILLIQHSKARVLVVAWHDFFYAPRASHFLDREYE